jgi:hypothetical protein
MSQTLSPSIVSDPVSAPVSAPVDSIKAVRSLLKGMNDTDKSILLLDILAQLGQDPRTKRPIKKGSLPAEMKKAIPEIGTCRTQSLKLLADMARVYGALQGDDKGIVVTGIRMGGDTVQANVDRLKDHRDGLV